MPPTLTVIAEEMGVGDVRNQKDRHWPQIAEMYMKEMTSVISDSCIFPYISQFSSIHFSHSVLSDSATPWIAARQASLSIIEEC